MKKTPHMVSHYSPSTVCDCIGDNFYIDLDMLYTDDYHRTRDMRWIKHLSTISSNESHAVWSTNLPTECPECIGVR